MDEMKKPIAVAYLRGYTFKEELAAGSPLSRGVPTDYAELLAFACGVHDREQGHAPTRPVQVK